MSNNNNNSDAFSDNSKNNNNHVVLDVSALLALFDDQPGAAVLLEHLPYAVISSVTLCEVIRIFKEEGGDPIWILNQISKLGFSILPFDQKQAELASSFLALPLGSPLSFYDRASLALATALQAPLYTKQLLLLQLPLAVPIRLI